MSPTSDDFYVGYADRAPRDLARFVRGRVVAVLAASVSVLALLAVFQGALPSGRFEFGVRRSFEGVLLERPLPMLRMEPPGGVARLLLVGFGKAGLPPFARGHHGRRVRFDGSLIVRENLAMVEMNDPDSFQVLEGRPAAEPAVPAARGRVRLVGELVDTKCYLGVMRPATGKVHRACAIRCLRGGVPPGLLVRDGAGHETVFLLAGTDGGRLEFDYELAGRQITVDAELELLDSLPVLRVDALRVAT